MIEIGIMIEGQNGLNWDRWTKISHAVEDLGFVGLYRSDHYTNASPPDKDSLELWVSLAWLASHTSRLEFGPLVSPLSFRDPTMTARMASAVDDLSNGRLVLGLGAGWQEREHDHFGWNLGTMKQRMDRFEEGLEVITSLLRSDEPVDFDGEYYRLHEAVMLPRPQRTGGPPILIGGSGPRRTLPLVARYATEWNSNFTSAKRFAELNTLLDDLLVQEGRRPDEVRRSITTGTFYASTEAALDEQIKRRTGGKLSKEDLRNRGRVVGAGAEIREEVEVYAQAGVQRIMLQWIDLDDLDGLASLAESVLA